MNKPCPDCKIAMIMMECRIQELSEYFCVKCKHSEFIDPVQQARADKEHEMIKKWMELN